MDEGNVVDKMDLNKAFDKALCDTLTSKIE